MGSYSAGFFLFLILKFYLLEQKTSIHVDESATFSLSFDQSKDFTPYPSNGKEESLAEFHNNMYGKAPLSPSVALKNIYKVRKDQKDTPHTNLYYSLINIAAINSQDTMKALIFSRWTVKYCAIFNFFFYSI